MLFFTLIPFWTFMGLAALGIVAGFGVRILIQDVGRQHAGQRWTRQARFEQLVGKLSQSAAIGLALTLVADLVLVAWTSDARLLAGLTVLIAALTSFASAFIRELIRRLFYK